MSRYNLRDVSERLTKSRTIESVIAEFLRTLAQMRSDWRPSLAFYEVSQDALVDVYELDGQRLVRRNIVVTVDRLPHRLVRKIFQTTTFLNEGDKRVVFATKDTSPCYVADERDASELMPLTVLAEWQSCICMPLGYQDDLIAMLVIASAKKNTFAGRAVGEIVPIKSVATVALAQHLYRTSRPRPMAAPAAAATAADDHAGQMQEKADALAAHSAKLDEENRDRSAQIEALMNQIEHLDRSSNTYKEELERVKETVGAMEEDSQVATEYLAEAFQQLQTTQWTLGDVERTVVLLKGAFQLLAEEHDTASLPQTLVEWFADRFGIERCSLLVPDAAGETLEVVAHLGIDPEIASRVRVRMGQGVAGWVAAHGKPLYVRMKEDAQAIPRSPDSTYNSDSFIVVPLAHNGRVHAVLNLSNRLDGEGFSEADLDRAMMAASTFAVTFGSHRMARRAAAWV